MVYASIYIPSDNMRTAPQKLRYITCMKRCIEQNRFLLLADCRVYRGELYCY